MIAVRRGGLNIGTHEENIDQQDMAENWHICWICGDRECDFPRGL